MRCPQCGTRNADSRSFCTSCGYALPLAPAEQSLTDTGPRSRAATSATAEPAGPRPSAGPVFAPSERAGRDQWREPYPRPPIVSLLAVLQFVAAAVTFVTALAFVATRVFGQDIRPDVEVALIVIGVLLVGLTMLELACAIGLWRVKPYGRSAQLLLCLLIFLAFPIGTAIAIAILVYMYKPGVVLLFSGRPREQMTAAEAEQLDAVLRGVRPSRPVTR